MSLVRWPVAQQHRHAPTSQLVVPPAVSVGPISFTAVSNTGTKTTAGLTVSVSLQATSTTGTKTTATFSAIGPLLSANSYTGTATSSVFMVLVNSFEGVSLTGTQTTASLSLITAIPCQTAAAVSGTSMALTARTFIVFAPANAVSSAFGQVSFPGEANLPQRTVVGAGI